MGQALNLNASLRQLILLFIQQVCVILTGCDSELNSGIWCSLILQELR